jgi:hypothetical protein
VCLRILPGGRLHHPLARCPRFQSLSAGAQLTLITDGVVEARDKNGRLFGFERTAALSTQPAEKVMSVAEAFGQEDDITVVTLARVPVPAGQTAELMGHATV